MKQKKGLTLIEFLVAISVFSIVVVGVLELFNSALEQQKASLTSVYLLNNASFVTEYITRSLRMAQKEESDVPQCLSQRGMNCEVTKGGKHIKFINHHGNCQEFYLQGDSLKIKTSQGEQSLLPSDISVENLRFSSLGEGQDDFLQTRITMVLELKTKRKPEKKISIQTTISQRELDIKK